nr:hypothetical protein [Micromonospora sp. 4G51]
MAKWRRALPDDAWPEGFPESGVVWRRDVFAVAESWRSEVATPRQLLAAALMWGYGLNGYGPWRAVKALNGDQHGERLTRALDGLRADHPTLEDSRAAFRSFRDAKVSRLPWLGPAFFTKVVYFAGYRRDGHEIQPLILDRVVAGRLPVEAGVRRRWGGWRSDEWIAYLQWAAERAAAAKVEPDAVEMALFRGDSLSS